MIAGGGTLLHSGLDDIKRIPKLMFSKGDKIAPELGRTYMVRI